jgi:hypothetical protein
MLPDTVIVTDTIWLAEAMRMPPDPVMVTDTIWLAEAMRMLPDPVMVTDTIWLAEAMRMLDTMLCAMVAQLAVPEMEVLLSETLKLP